MTDPAAREWAEWTRVHDVHGASLDLLCARFVHHRYAPHAHEQYAIGACTGGRELIAYRGDRHFAGPGSVVVIEPDEAHTGGAADETGLAYRALYPDGALLGYDHGDGDAGNGEVGGAGIARPHFPEPVIHDPELAARLLRVHTLLSRPHDRLEAESRLAGLLASLVLRHATPLPATFSVPTGPAGAGGMPGGRTRRAREVSRTVMARLTDDLADPPSLTELARDAGLSRFQLLRTFSATVGMPPYAWLAQYRVARARALLEAGVRPAQAAVLAGFADQAHLTRWFRRVVGVTPGAFRNSVQDGARGPG